MASSTTISPQESTGVLAFPRRVLAMQLPWIPLSIVIVLLACSAFAPILTPYDPGKTSILDSRTAPGRDVGTSPGDRRPGAGCADEV